MNEQFCEQINRYHLQIELATSDNSINEVKILADINLMISAIKINFVKGNCKEANHPSVPKDKTILRVTLHKEIERTLKYY